MRVKKGLEEFRRVAHYSRRVAVRHCRRHDRRGWAMIGMLAAIFGWTSAPTAQSQDEERRFDYRGTAMGTTVLIVLYGPQREAAERAVAACFRRLEELDRMMSDYDDDSELMRLCRSANGEYQTVSPSLGEVLHSARSIAEATDGAYDPTCGHLTQLWRKMKKTGKAPSSEEIAWARERTDYHRLTVDRQANRVLLTPGTRLDLGGIAKGFAADILLQILSSQGLERSMVQVGGDTAVGAAPPGQEGWTIHLRTSRDEADSSKASGKAASDRLPTVTVVHRGISTSGDLYQGVEIEGKRYSHIIAPRQGIGLEHGEACSVVAPNAATSDGLATALCVLGKERGDAFVRERRDIVVYWGESIAQ